MDRPPIKRQDVDDCDFEEELEGDCECGNWKNENRPKCDQCLYAE